VFASALLEVAGRADLAPARRSWLPPVSKPGPVSRPWQDCAHGDRAGQGIGADVAYTAWPGSRRRGKPWLLADIQARRWARAPNLVMTRKGSPLTPRTARAIGLAIGERCEGPIFPATPAPQW